MAGDISDAIAQIRDLRMENEALTQKVLVLEKTMVFN